MTEVSPEPHENNALYTAILQRGTFYCPAGAHYGNPSASVICDRCRRSNIPACIGFERNDLCLPCTELLALRLPVITHSQYEVVQRIPTTVREYPRVTLMIQEMFEMPRTRMEHSMFRR